MYGFVQAEYLCPYVAAVGDDGYVVVEMWRDNSRSIALMRLEELACRRLKYMCWRGV